MEEHLNQYGELEKDECIQREEIPINPHPFDIDKDFIDQVVQKFIPILPKRPEPDIPLSFMGIPVLKKMSADFDGSEMEQQGLIIVTVESPNGNKYNLYFIYDQYQGKEFIGQTKKKFDLD